MQTASSHPIATPTKRKTVNRTGKFSRPQPLHAAQFADALLKIQTAAAVAGLSATSIYRKAATDPTFPKLIKMGTRCTRIRAADLMAWLAAQAGA